MNCSRLTCTIYILPPLLYFPSSKTEYGIIHIKETTQPSGLLVFSDDHNLEYNLLNNDYLQQIEENSKSKH